MHSGSETVIIAGGGLAGLTAATFLARAGRPVTLFEKAQDLGGRAATHEKSGFRFNLGPHALYRHGHGSKVLRELGISFRGGVPNASGGYAVDGGIKHALPGGFVSLLTTGLFGLPAKFETARLLSTFQKIDAESLHGITVEEWLSTALRQPGVRGLVRALFRLSTYANDPERQSAGSAVAQMQLALSANVLYLDGGWQTLVDGLRHAAREAGVEIVTSNKVVAVEHDGTVRGVRLADGTRRPATAVIVAASPAAARALVDGGCDPILRDWDETAIPIEAACLDVGLKRLPRLRTTFALGIDRPLYLSVHSAVARLAPDDAATIQVAKYLNPNQAADPRHDERELEELLDLIQPGWRELVVERRFLPSMTVSHWLPVAAGGGLRGRPGPEVPSVRNLYVAGDWVGPAGHLADASLASAKAAAQMVLHADQSRAAAA